MNKTKLNFIIDALMFLCMTAITGLGLLMKFVLIPGKERWVRYGRNVDLFLFDMDRHEWGTVHLILGFILLGLLLLHIILHWKTILGMYRKLIDGQRVRRNIAYAFAVVCSVLLFLPLLITPEVRNLAQGKGHYHHSADMYSGKATTAVPRSGAEDSYQRSPIEIRGYMTLSEVSEKYHVPVEYLKGRLGIPQSSSERENLGWLRKRYSFKMDDVARLVNGYRESR